MVQLELVGLKFPFLSFFFYTFTEKFVFLVISSGPELSMWAISSFYPVRGRFFFIIFYFTNPYFYYIFHDLGPPDACKIKTLDWSAIS